LPASLYFKLEKERKTTLSILVDDDTKLDPYKLQVPGNHNPPALSEIITHVYKTKLGATLDIIPSTLDLMYLALGKSDGRIEPIEERFDKFVQQCRSEYDVTIIDCHPAGSLFTKTSLRNSDHVIIPVMPQRYAVRGIGLMMQFMDAKKAGSAAPTPYILFNHTPRIGVSPVETSIRSDAKYAKYCLENTLKRYKAFSEPEEGKNFVWASNKPYSTEAFTNLLKVSIEFINKSGV